MNNEKQALFIEKPTLSGRLRYTIYKNGLPIERFEDNNLIVNEARLRLARLLAGDNEALSQEQVIDGLFINSIAFGTNGDIPTVGDTEITDPFIKGFEGFSYPSVGSVEFKWKLQQTEANGKAIREFGLLTADGSLFARRFRDKPITKDSDISIEGEWIIIFN